MPEAACWPAVESTPMGVRRIFHQIDATLAAKVRYFRGLPGNQTTNMDKHHGPGPSTNDMLEGVERETKIRTDISQDDSVARVKDCKCARCERVRRDHNLRVREIQGSQDDFKCTRPAVDRNRMLFRRDWCEGLLKRFCVFPQG